MVEPEGEEATLNHADPNREKWAQIEYQEIGEYGRSIYAQFFPMARITIFLSGGYAGILTFLVSTASIPVFAYYLMIFVAFIGIIFNIGALILYNKAIAILEHLYIRLKEIEIEDKRNLKIHLSLGVSFREGLKTKHLTNGFYGLLIFMWFVFIYIIVKEIDVVSMTNF